MDQIDVLRWLATHDVTHRVHHHAPVRNVDEAAAAGLDFDPGLLIKTLVLRLPEGRFGWQAGGAAPLGVMRDVRILVDEAVLRLPVMYFGGGRRDTTVEAAPAELFSRVPHTVCMLTRPEVRP